MIRTLIISGIALAYVAVTFTSARPWTAISQAGIDDVGAAAAAVPGAPPGTRIGYSYREFSIARLPFVVHREAGPVLYLTTPNGPRLAPVAVADAVSTRPQEYAPFARGATLAWWRHVWGWLFVLAFGAWWYLSYRAETVRGDD